MKKYLAEMVGTMVLVLMGCGTAVSLGCTNADPETVVGTALAFGLAVVAMAYTIGGISGCHINPAITLGCLISGRISGKDAAMYMLFQVIGAILGTTDSKVGAGNFAGLAIGLSLVLVHLVCIRYTGTSVNPARSIGPALFEGGNALAQLWIFIVGPFIGAAIAAGIWKMIAPCKCEK